MHINVLLCLLNIETVKLDVFAHLCQSLMRLFRFKLMLNCFKAFFFMSFQEPCPPPLSDTMTPDEVR